MKKKCDGVWLADPGIVRWRAHHIAFVEREAPLTEKKRARICAHQEGEKLHEMLIAFTAESRNPLHKHNEVESIFVIKGRLQVDSVLLAGSIQTDYLGAGEFLRIPAGIMHKPTPLTDCVILETILK